VGGILTYTAEASNLGPDPATGVTLTVSLSSSVFFVSATASQGSCTQASGAVTCNLGNVSLGSTETATIAVEPQTQGTIASTAKVTAAEPDPVSGNDLSQTTTTVSPGGYARPKGATSTRTSLVPAFRGCDTDQATLSHGPPLEQPSCASPSPTSGYLTFGAPDVNGQVANATGFVRLTQIGEGPPIIIENGDQADIAYDLELTDVRNASDLSDYTGELQLRAAVRLTDKNNSLSGNAAATVTDMTIAFNVPCAETASPSIGGSCAVSTTAEALVPDMVKERKRGVWELGKLRVLDGGADGDAETGPNTLFAVQGVFVP
jgi:uncharacterized repeat protein (TIGR01451 family)